MGASNWPSCHSPMIQILNKLQAREIMQEVAVAVSGWEQVAEKNNVRRTLKGALPFKW